MSRMVPRGFRRWWLALALLALAAPGFAQRVPAAAEGPTAGRFPTVRFQRGDDARWAARDFDDSGWREMSGRDLPARDGIYWVRLRVRQWHPPPLRPLDGLLLKVVASYDLYWDGNLIGRSGVVGENADGEEPGNVDALFQIPRELLGPGQHVIALRLSSFHTGFRGPTYGLNVAWGNFREQLLYRSRAAILSVMAVGAALVVAVVFGLMWLLAGRRTPVLLFSVLFLCVAAMQALQAWRWLFDYPYSWHFPRLLAITLLVTGMAVLLPAFVMHHFGVGRARRVYLALGVLLAVAWTRSHVYNFVSLYLSAVGFITAFVLAAMAVRRGKRGAGFACGGLALSLVALVGAPGDFLEHAFFLSAGPAVLGLLVALVLQLRDERREAQQAVLTAARLEIELLKKNIQPHFLLNTLATIQEVIEQEPRTAVVMIDALASEFRILNRVSGEKLITLEHELELCRAHLRVMSLRKGARCSLQVGGVDESARVPPALFHTLIENGLTHLMPRDGRLEFELRAEQRPPWTRYVLLARGQRQPNAAESAGAEGTGLRYIKARLQESFLGNWSLVAGPVLEGWETVIEVGSVSTGPETARGPAAGGGVVEKLPQEKPA